MKNNIKKGMKVKYNYKHSYIFEYGQILTVKEILSEYEVLFTNQKITSINRVKPYQNKIKKL